MMSLPDTFWVTLSNLVLGFLVVLAALFAVLATLGGVISTMKKRRAFRAELNHDMHEMFAGSVPHIIALHPQTPAHAHPALQTLRRISRLLFRRPPRLIR